MNIIENMKVKRAGVDYINVGTIKTLVEFITEILIHIMNLRTERKFGLIYLRRSLLIKARTDTSDMSNYRPVSLVSNLNF